MTTTTGLESTTTAEGADSPAPIDAAPPGSVVVGVDGSTGAEAAIDWAADAANHAHRTLTVVHTEAPIPPWYSTGYGGTIVSMADLRVAVLAAGRACTTSAAERARARHPELAIVEISDTRDPRRWLIEASERARLVVVGSRGRGPMATALLGSVSLALTREAHCPVVVIRPDDGNDTPATEVVALVDGAPGSTGVLEMAFRTAADLDVPVRVLHVLWTSADLSDIVLDDARMLLARTTAGLGEKYPEVTAMTEVITVAGPTQLLERTQDAALIVVGHQPASTLHRLLYRSVSAAVLERASVPVAVVRSES